jgi:ribosomal protein S18 acetylase RimI-like enzyme
VKTKVDVLASGAERARTGSWRAHGGVAFLAPDPDAPILSPSFVASCLDELAGRGFSSVITAAIPLAQRQAFVAAGFEEQERLRLLTHDLSHLSPVPGTALRRARRGDRARVLTIDGATFPGFWRLDELGLDQAIGATAWARFRVALDPRPDGDGVVGYAITGLDRSEGYMQRLAVDPAHHRRGMGRALALDGLHWLRRRRARRALVNTQVGNDAAFSLYLALGFRLEPSELVVLRRDLT